jgi:thymidylate synthase
MRIYRDKYIAHAFNKVLFDLYYKPDYTVEPRGMKVKEILNCSLVVEDPMVNMYTNTYRSAPLKYIAAEILWYLSGSNYPDFIEKYASMWSSLTNLDGTVNSAYGNLIFYNKNIHGVSQYQWVIESLKRDKDSRQAFMHFNLPSHQYFDNKDQVCTLQAVFHIRNNKLNMTLTMRSNDVIRGFHTDFVFFSILQYHVYLHMKQYYPELEMGSYTHISHSMHLYEKHFDLVKNMLNADFDPDKLPLIDQFLIQENGNYLEKYNNVFAPIAGQGECIYPNTDSTFLNYLIEHIKPKE